MRQRDRRGRAAVPGMSRQGAHVAVELLRDDFAGDAPAGSVIGSVCASGHERLGIDVERVLSMDNGALRIAPLIESGFGRAGLSYGPFKAQPGLAFAVHILNGHNTAQAEPLPYTFRERMNQWILGSRVEPSHQRLLRWLWSGRIRRTLRQFRIWKRKEKGGKPVPLLDENLAVGWFASANAPDPLADGNAFIMHALGPENGELWAGSSQERVRSLRGVQDLPLYLVAVMRERGTVYYAASLDGAAGLTPYPWLRPLAIDSGACPDKAFLGVHQSALGQIGWRIDTRVQGVRVARLSGYETWWGGAHAADRLSLGTVPTGVEGEIGGAWQRAKQNAEDETATGLGFLTSRTYALLNPGAPSGLVHAVVAPGSNELKGVGLVWRFLDEGNHWRFTIRGRTCELVRVTEGASQVIASRGVNGSFTREHRLQVLDDGHAVMACLDGEAMSGASLIDPWLGDATKVGVLVQESDANAGTIRSFEAHPRRIRLPEVLDSGQPWLRKGSRIVVEDEFLGEPADLDGRLTPVGRARWRRIIGEGNIDLTGSGVARVRATSQEPCPGRTAYCVECPHPEFVDLEVTITPPGRGTGQREMTTSGFIIYQDSRNYVTLNAYRADSYGGGSVSTFFKFGGFEDLFDAVWCNVGNRVTYGKPLRLRLCCDGEQYLVFIDEEPVLYRAFRDVHPDFDRLQIRQVGIVANWEFGTDTGSTFEQFKLRV